MGNKDPIRVTQQPHAQCISSDCTSDPGCKSSAQTGVRWVHLTCYRCLPVAGKVSPWLWRAGAPIHMPDVCQEVSWGVFIIYSMFRCTRGYLPASPTVSSRLTKVICASRATIITWHQMKASPSPAGKDNPSYAVWEQRQQCASAIPNPCTSTNAAQIESNVERACRRDRADSVHCLTGLTWKRRQRVQLLRSMSERVLKRSRCL